MRYGSLNLPLAHARGSATLGFRLREPCLAPSPGPALPQGAAERQKNHLAAGRTTSRKTTGLATAQKSRVNAASPHFSRQTVGADARPGLLKVLTGLGWVIEWDGVCISRMGGHGGPPLQTKPVQRRSSERS